MQNHQQPPDARRLDREILEALEQSQAEIGESLHDTLCQTLSGAALMANALARRATGGGAVSADELTQMADLLDRTLDGTRALSHQLDPLQGGAAGLMTALERLAAGTALTVSCEFRCLEPVVVIEAAAAVTLYRVAEGAVQNALGSTSVARIRISLEAANGFVEVSIRADGAAGAKQPEEGRRLRLMRYRAEAAGGALSNDQSTDGRTTVRCRLPQATT